MATQDEHVGMSGLAADAMGLGWRGQMGWMQFQLFYMPSTWRRTVGGVAKHGLKWRGPLLGGLAASPLEAFYGGLTGKSRIPFVSSFLRGFDTMAARSAVNLEAARNVTREGMLSSVSKLHQLGMPGLLQHPDISPATGQFQRYAGRVAERMFTETGMTRKGLYRRSFEELFTGRIGERVTRGYFGAEVSEEMLTAGRRLYRKGAARTLIGGLGRVMYPVTIAMDFALVASLAVGLGSMMGRTAVGIVNRLSQYNQLDFGTGVYAASNFQASITERQRALQMIQRNSMNARRAIGNEAALMHV